VKRVQKHANPQTNNFSQGYKRKTGRALKWQSDEDAKNKKM